MAADGRQEDVCIISALDFEVELQRSHQPGSDADLQGCTAAACNDTEEYLSACGYLEIQTTKELHETKLTIHARSIDSNRPSRVRLRKAPRAQ